MNVKRFKDSLDGDRPPQGLSSALTALWYDAAGKWRQAHETVQGQDGSGDAWVHAYLHRKEGDLANAAYWYRRCGRPLPESPLDVEWENIVAGLLHGGAG